jgi:hypothetical protein
MFSPTWLLAVVALCAGSMAMAADLPGPRVELASDGGLDVRSSARYGVPKGHR